MKRRSITNEPTDRAPQLILHGAYTTQKMKTLILVINQHTPSPAQSISDLNPDHLRGAQIRSTMKPHALADGMHMPSRTWRHNPHTVIIRQHTKNKKLTHTRPTAIRFNNHPARCNAQACIPPTPSPPRLSLSFVCSFAFSFVRPSFLPFFPEASQRSKMLRCNAPCCSSPLAMAVRGDNDAMREMDPVMRRRQPTHAHMSHHRVALPLQPPSAPPPRVCVKAEPAYGLLKRGPPPLPALPVLPATPSPVEKKCFQVQPGTCINLPFFFINLSIF